MSYQIFWFESSCDMSDSCLTILFICANRFQWALSCFKTTIFCSKAVLSWINCATWRVSLPIYLVVCATDVFNRSITARSWWAKELTFWKRRVVKTITWGYAILEKIISRLARPVRTICYSFLSSLKSRNLFSVWKTKEKVHSSDSMSPKSHVRFRVRISIHAGILQFDHTYFRNAHLNPNESNEIATRLEQRCIDRRRKKKRISRPLYSTPSLSKIGSKMYTNLLSLRF